jgi:histidyl-tRNA synthetase
MLKLSKKADPMSEHKIYKPKPISGFPEWLPEYRIVEQQWMDKIRAVFESYGFCNIETSSAEEIEVLTAKGGETENEIYTLTRLQADENDKKDARLALRYDLTVPMARYVAQNFGQLVFPFKRYQMQKSWRGERPQKGRYREFYQCDIDVIGVDDLPLHFDAELPAVLYQAYEALDIPPVTIHISNRKIVVGYLQGLGVTDVPFVTRTLDKIDKIRRDGARKILTEFGMTAELADKCLAIVAITSTDAGFADRVRALGVTHDQLTEGLDELTFVMNNLKHLPEGAVLADLGIIRGLDYYTGTVLEVRFRKSDITRSIGGGGRYENLAGSFINQKLPGIGVSIGFTRLFGLLMDEGKIKPGKKTPAEILVALPDESHRAEASATAHILRQRGYKVEMYHRAAKIKNQMAYAEKKGINFVWFPPFKEGQPHEVKDMATGEQKPADPQNWKM